MTFNVFAELRSTPASRVVHGVAPLAEARGYALLCDAKINASLLACHVRVVGSMHDVTCELPVEATNDPIDCMACLVAGMVSR